MLLPPDVTAFDANKASLVMVPVVAAALSLMLLVFPVAAVAKKNTSTMDDLFVLWWVFGVEPQKSRQKNAVICRLARAGLLLCVAQARKYQYYGRE